jgi:hypothetical protein
LRAGAVVDKTKTAPVLSVENGKMMRDNPKTKDLASECTPQRRAWVEEIIEDNTRSVAG